MLRNLLDEVVRRRLWPIPLVAVLVAVAAPLLFLKPAPPDAPLASMAAPPVAPAAELPARAQRLLTGSDAGAADERGPRSRKSDPFQAPSSRSDSTSASGSDPASTDETAPGVRCLRCPGRRDGAEYRRGPTAADDAGAPCAAGRR